VSDKLNDFLIEVASDPDKADAFRRDPVSFLDRTRLTSEDRVAVLTGDSRRIRATADAMDPPVAIIGPVGGTKGGKKKGGKKKQRREGPPVATKQPKTKRAPAGRKTTRKTSRKSSKKK
jgi:hypothetical protein